MDKPFGEWTTEEQAVYYNTLLASVARRCATDQPHLFSARAWQAREWFDRHPELECWNRPVEEVE